MGGNCDCKALGTEAGGVGIDHFLAELSPSTVDVSYDAYFCLCGWRCVFVVVTFWLVSMIGRECGGLIAIYTLSRSYQGLSMVALL